jgi:hypothetical protein
VWLVIDVEDLESSIAHRCQCQVQNSFPTLFYNLHCVGGGGGMVLV